MLLIADFGSEINPFIMPHGSAVHTAQLSFYIPWCIIKDKIHRMQPIASITLEFIGIVLPILRGPLELI